MRHDSPSPLPAPTQTLPKFISKSESWKILRRGGRQENFQQKVLLFYVSTYLPTDRSIGSAMEKEERGISASEHKYEIIFFPKRGHFDAARAPRPRGARRGDGRTRRRLYALSGEVSSTCYFLTYFFSCTRRDLNCAARFANFLSVPGK